MARVLLVLAVLFISSYAAKIPWAASRLDGRIVGGEDANIEDLPYQLSLEKYGSHRCGASIISAEWAITAAHCVVLILSTPNVLTFRSGTSKRDQGGTIHKVAEIIVHPDHNPTTYEYDYALVRVADKFKIGQPGVQAVALADEEPKAGDECTVSGWGSRSFEAITAPIQLQRVDVPLVDRHICEEQYEAAIFPIAESMICAGLTEGGKDACQGDSGGPLVSNGRLVGIVSWGYRCASPNHAGIYANVAFQRDWIKSVSGV